jgi:hypothetical protein
MPQHEPDRVRVERLFKTREQQKADAPKAMADYRAAEEALRNRTQELRRLRLAREARIKRLARRGKAKIGSYSAAGSA